MRILVTGGAGYIGSQCVLELLSRGHTPVVYDNLSGGHRWAVQAGRFYEAELSDRAFLLDVLRREEVEAVVHFASSILVGESCAAPSAYFWNNYVNTLHLLDAMVEAGVGLLVFSSSAAVYGTPLETPIREDAPGRPVNPYGLTKHFIEETLGWYGSAYGLRHVSLRYFNAAGADPELRTGEAHRPETHLVPLVLMAALGRRDFIEVYGTDYNTPDGTCIRDYTHVADLAVAHSLALDYVAGGGESRAFNLGTGRGHSVREVIGAAGKVTGKDIPVRFGPRRQGDPPVLVAESSLAGDALGWRPGHADIEVIVLHAWQWLVKALREGHIRE